MEKSLVCYPTFREGLIATRSLGKKLLAFWDLRHVRGSSTDDREITHGLATEADALLRIKDGALVLLSVSAHTSSRDGHKPPRQGT